MDAYRVKIDDVSFRYEGCPPVIRGVSFEAAPGEVLAIIAPVGCGKSTLLKICATILRPSSGRVYVNGKDVWSIPTAELNLVRQHMGFYFQEPALISNMTIFDNLALSLRYHSGRSEAGIRNEINGWLERLDMAGFRDMLPAAVSAGLRLRVGFIRTILLGQAFLFWDEPTHGADRHFAEMVSNAIAEKKREGIGAILTTQSGSFLNKLADKAVILTGGQVAYYGKVAGGKISAEFSMDGMLEES